jgi:integrase
MTRKTVDRWYSRLAPATVEVNRYHLNRFLEWLKINGGVFSPLTPDELIQYQKETVGETRYEILDMLQSYVSSFEGRHGYKQKIYSTIRSYFKHNRAELPQDPNYRINGDRPKVVGSLTPTEIKEVVLSSKPVYQAIFMSMLQGGMGREEFKWWNLNGWSQLSEELRNNPIIIKIDLPGRKKMKNIRPYFTFIGRDAIEKIKLYLPLRPSDAESIFTDQNGNPVSSHAVKQYWNRHLVKIGLIKPEKNPSRGTRYGKNPHEMRDVFRSLWEKSPANSSVAEFCMGHEVDRLEYNKAYKDERWVSREYEKAEPFLNLLSSPRPFGQVDEDELIYLQRQVKALEQRKDNRVEELEEKVDELTRMLKLIYDNPELAKQLKKT